MVRLLFPCFTLSFIFFLEPFFVLAGDPSQSEYAASINIAGRQRMLSQRAVKEALQIVLGIDVEKSRERLRDTMALFERSLRGLLKGDSIMGLPVPTVPVAKQAKSLETAWKRLKDELKNVGGGKIDLTKLSVSDFGVLSEAEALVKVLRGEYQAEAGQTWGGILDVSGKQRMLSQKMTKEMYQILLKVDPENNRVALKNTVETFDRALRGLMKGGGEMGLAAASQQMINDHLETVRLIWSDFRPFADQVVLKGDLSGVLSGVLSTDDLRKVADLSNRLLEESDQVVSLYEGLSGGN